MAGKRNKGPQTAFLDGKPRVHLDKLDFVPDVTYPDDEGLYFHNGEPYTGVAWEEKRGCLTESSVLEGQLHGRNVSFHANGQMARDGCYEEGFIVGELFTWYDSGVTEFHGIYGPFEKLEVVRDYNEEGTLTREIDERQDWRLRHWTQQGKLLYESSNGVSTCYAADGSWAIREHDHGPLAERDPPEYRDDILFQHAFRMLGDLDLVNYPVYRWLRGGLDRSDSRAKLFLVNLLNHSSIGIIEFALKNIGERMILEAVPAVRDLTSSKQRRDPGAAGFHGPIGEIADLVLVELTIQDEEKQKIELGKLHETSARRELLERQQEKARQKRRARIQHAWPEVEASFDDTSVGKLTLQSADQVLSADVDSAIESRTDYWHYYSYIVDDRTYRACVITTDPEPAETISVRYRVKDPAEHVIDATVYNLFNHRETDDPPS